ncbi:CCA tRNA nucleotidyltransferase [Stappia sp.]|uniref:CCA tRNA nucleotidyltransferase n=1 Tax=Stappia sp. TaxID=1870903 RepID=UPI003D14A1DB
MTARIDSDWLCEPGLQAAFDAIGRDGDSVRVVGGAVRNTLMGLPVTDIDIATDAVPDTVIARAEAAGLKAVATGYEHGTITVVSHGTAYEVTTLREDVETHGRSATVRFGRDWQRDAERRDFTMNALYAARDGIVHDPVGGLPDLAARHVRFIGDAHRRIREDYLRILRFFRFHAQYGDGALDEEGLAAVVELKAGIAGLSAERIGMEMRKLVSAPRAAETLAEMERAGVTPMVLATQAGLAPFRALRALDHLAPNTRDPALALAALSDGDAAELDAVADHLRLANAERRRMKAAFSASRWLAEGLAARGPGGDPRLALELLHRFGREAGVDGVLLAWSNSGPGPDDPAFKALLAQALDLDAPVFPLSGRDLTRAGVAAGPEIGRRLALAEDRWVASGFTLERATLLDIAVAG